MNYEFKTEPFDHQSRIFNATCEEEFFGLLWEQGTCKTKPTIDTAAHLFEQGKIDAVLVVAPNGVHRNWITDELPKHLPDRIMAQSHMFFWRSQKSGTKYHQHEFEAALKHEGLPWFCMSYNGFMTGAGKKAVWKFLQQRRCFYVLDESHHIKTPGAKRTRSIGASGRYAPYRRILTGTPGDKPFDLYSQLKFLDPGIWHRHGMGDFHGFKTRYGVWLTREECKQELHYDPGYDKLLDYKNLDELATILKSVSDRVLKEDVFDLPPKLYTKLYFDMTPKQAAMYEELRKEYELELASGLVIDGSLAIVRLLRLQQITCGYAVANSEEPIELCDVNNPRLDAAIDYLGNLPHQAIIWSRFTYDIDLIMDALGDKAVRYDGKIDDDACERSKQAFNAGGPQFFVGNTAKGSEGLTLNGAKTVAFYSNSFKFIHRTQAEDRNHRYGQDGADHGEMGFGVLYVDLCAPGTVDDHITENLRGKFDIAAQLTGDRLRSWI